MKMCPCKGCPRAGCGAYHGQCKRYLAWAQALTQEREFTKRAKGVSAYIEVTLRRTN